MDDRRISANKTAGKIIVVLLFLVAASLLFNIYNLSIISKFNKHLDAERREVLVAATEAFIRLREEQIGEELNAHDLGGYTPFAIHNEDSNSWMVEFRRREVEGEEAMVIYTFSIKNRYLANYENLRAFGTL